MTPEVERIVSSHKIFSGGRRHHEIISSLLPEGHEWIEIAVPLHDVYDRYSQFSDIVVFASGDPLFYGFAATLRREFPEADIKVFPTFNSIQTLAHRLVLPYHDVVNVSVTGRPWKGLDKALITGQSLVGVLTDRHKNPVEIARRMIDYGYTNYMMSVGESLGNREDEKISPYMSLHEVISRDFTHPNCVILHRTHVRPRRLGIPENEFYHLDGREKMITKMPIRLLSLSMLDLGSHSTIWDIGFCTGSVSIEARLQFPDVEIVAFEKRPECHDIMERNCRRHGSPGINIVTGDFFELDLSQYPKPDAVFIGGHGGRLPEMLRKIFDLLLPGGVVVFNSVSQESCQNFIDTVTSLGHTIEESHNIILDSHNPITILKAK